MIADLIQLIASDDFDARRALELLERESDFAPAKAALKPELHERWLRLWDETAVPAKDLQKWRARRGYLLESIVCLLIALDGLRPDPPYRLAGEQIDGLFEYRGRHFLLETKWQMKEAGAAELFAFRGKLEGKLQGTLGVFVSVGGYSKDAADALRLGKGINVVLFDDEDLDLALRTDYSFAEILDVKLRHAARYGQTYYPFQMYLDEIETEQS